MKLRPISAVSPPVATAARRRSRTLHLAACLAAAAVLAAAPPASADLADEVGRNEVRVYSARFEIPTGVTVADLALPERLDRLGYRRVHRRPEAPGEYFWGHEVFWIHRHPARRGDRVEEARLFSLELARPDGRVTGYGEGGRDEAWIEAELLAESFAADRARRVPVDFEALPEHVWRPLLAAEDARFFDHRGVDARALARATLKNVLAGKVVQGGSTITQQLVKMRDLSPRRSLGRKASEAVRSLALEAEHDKEEILEAYLDHVYLGHVGGVGVYGYGAGARAWFGEEAGELDVGEAALLAALVQGPNRLSPREHPERALARYRWVLDRMAALGWLDEGEAERLGRSLPRIARRSPEPAGPPAFLGWVGSAAAEMAPERAEEERGMIVETTLDPHLQALAEEAVEEGLTELRRRRPSLARERLTAALVTLDAGTGDVLAHVGGDPASTSGFDRVRRARRQPGSLVKPFVLLEAFDDCGDRGPEHPAREVLDAPLTLDLPSGPWAPVNDDLRFRGEIDLRRALELSLNVPFVRLARWCGMGETAAKLRRVDLLTEADGAPPPAFVLGALETTPLDLAAAYTAFAGDLGRVADPRPVSRVRRPSGKGIERERPDERRVAARQAAYLVRDLLVGAVENGTAAAAGFPAGERREPWAKTGTSSGSRDAWLAGGAGSLVTVVWVGLDGGGPLGLGGAAAAAPIWRAFMRRAAPARPAPRLEPPRGVVERWIEVDTGLLVRRERDGARRELFRRRHLPPQRRALFPDPPVEPIE